MERHPIMWGKAPQVSSKIRLSKALKPDSKTWIHHVGSEAAAAESVQVEDS